MKFYAPTKLSENIHETPEGFLICYGVRAGRTGEMIYGRDELPLECDDNGRIIVTRDEEELFRPETIASFEGKAITIRHPEEFVCPDTWKMVAKGHIQNTRRGEGDAADDLVFDVLITDAMAIGLVKNGLREVSLGYEAEYEQSEKGKGKQFNIVGNHLALVEEGRAGRAYAINDHKGTGKETKSMKKKKKLGEQLKALFSKTGDEAAKILDESSEEGMEKKESKDESGSEVQALTMMVKELLAKLAAMGGEAKDEKKDDKADKAEKKEESKDEDKDEEKKEKAEDEEVVDPIEERLKALELAVKKILGEEADEEDEDGEEELEEIEDDAEEVETLMTGDTAARAEILAPGIKVTKDVKTAALKKAYGTAEGKKVIDSLSGGKPTFDSAEKVNTLFIAASELLKNSRASEFSKTKQTRDSFSSVDESKVMTPAKMNEINAAKWNR